MSIERQVRKTLEELFGRKISEDFAQKNEDDWDSFMQLEIISQLEARFEISLSPKEIGSMVSYKSIVEIVKDSVKNNG